MLEVAHRGHGGNVQMYRCADMQMEKEIGRWKLEVKRETFCPVVHPAPAGPKLGSKRVNKRNLALQARPDELRSDGGNTLRPVVPVGQLFSEYTSGLRRSPVFVAIQQGACSSVGAASFLSFYPTGGKTLITNAHPGASPSANRCFIRGCFPGATALHPRA